MFVRLLHGYPFLSLAQALTVLRIATAIFFMAHAIVRIADDTIPQFALRLAHEGWPVATAIVWAITVCEIVSGAALILDRYVRLATFGLLFIAAMGIVIIHAQLGWFVGEHGTGGMEYSVALIVSLITIAAADGDASQHAAGKW